MAYPGGIDFISDAKKSLKVPRSVDLDFADHGRALVVKVRQFENCRMKQEGKDHAVFDALGKVGSLWFDVTDRIAFKHCVVIGMDDYDGKEDPRKTYYFLLVREKLSREGYERIGVGKAEAQYVSKASDAGKLW
jgi:hypothetical protein